MKPALPSHLLQILLIQLVVRTHGHKEDQEILSGDALIFCLFDILNKIIDSGNGNHVMFDAKKEMENRTSCGFEIKNIFQLRTIVRKLANRKELKKLVDNLMNCDNIRLVNWPMIEGAIQVEFETKSAEGKKKFVFL